MRPKTKNIFPEFFNLDSESTSGRQRYNVLGASHAMTGAMVSVTNTTYINSSSVVELLGKLSLLHPEGG